MKRTQISLNFLSSMIFLLIGVTASAQWSTVSTANNRVCFAPGSQIIPQAVTDGAGGLIIAWQDLRSGENDIYAQRINASGVSLWTLDGDPVCTSTGSQYLPTITNDGQGGAIMAWNQGAEIYAQRVDANGTDRWQANGVPVLSGTYGVQPNPHMVSDGNGGGIITWTDQRNGIGTQDIYAQRIDSQGVAQWTVNGVVICSATGIQDDPQIIGDGADGAIIAWQDRRGTDSTDVYAQKIDASGVVQWTPNGIAVCAITNAQTFPVVTRDGSGGAFIAWVDERAGATKDIYAQRVSSAGAALWTTNGVIICNATGDQQSPDIVRVGAGEAIIAWQDGRLGTKIYAQRIDAAGAVQWAVNGILTANTSFGADPRVIRDGSAGAIIAFGGGGDIFAQRLDGSGNLLWTNNGVTLSNAVGSQQSLVIVGDDNEGAFVAWEDRRSGVADIYAQNVDSAGVLGRPVPVITALNDVADDQGGEIRVTWSPSNHDIFSDTSLQNYQVFRGEMSGSANPDTIVYTLLGSVPASQQTNYSFNVPTLSDSDWTGVRWYYVKVRARISGSVYWDSETDSAYSIDNLAPAPPSNTQIEQLSQRRFRLWWDSNTADPDVAEYHVHRSTTDGFLVGDSTLHAITTDTTIVDTLPFPAIYYYRITTVDIHGNEGSPTAQLSTLVTGLKEDQTPTAFALRQNYPNPFNPTTSIQFDLPSAEHVTLTIYNLLGQEVKTLVNGFREAGRYAERLDGSGLASGVYLYRLTTPTRTATKKLVLMK